MTGQFSFTLLNPVLALILAITFGAVWRKRPDQPYLALLALTFTCSGVAFVITDLLPSFDAPLSRIAANALFLAAIVSASAASLLRVGAPLPVTLYLITCTQCATGFYWFLLVTPSTEMRIYIVNAAFAVLAGATAWQLHRAGSRNTVDRIFIALSLALMVLAVARPLATIFNHLDTNAAGSLRDSAYWATVQAGTPILAIAIGLAFLGALAIRLMDELAVEANRDFLTGLLNRRGLDRGVQKMLAGRHAPGAGPAVIIVDIDNFKAINDSFGHAIGDDVITTLAGILSAHGDADLVSRTGGEEFTLFYRACPRNELLGRAEAIRTALAATAFTGLPQGRAVTVSMGLHSRSQNQSMTEMMAAADRALYSAKRAGKDRAILAPAPVPLGPVLVIHERRTGSRVRGG